MNERSFIKNFVTFVLLKKTKEVNSIYHKHKTSIIRSPLINWKTMKTRGNIKDKQSAILNAALTLITEYGFHGTSMKMIATEAKVAAGTIYVHFKDKEEMINSLYTHISSEIDQLVKDQYNKELPFEDNFINTWKALLKYYISDLRVPEFATQYAYSPYITKNARTESDQILNYIIDMFKMAQEKGIIKDLPMIALIALAHGPITSMLRMTRYNEVDIKDIDLDAFSHACWNAIKV